MSKITLTIGTQSIAFAADDVHFVTGALHEALSHATGSSKYTGRDGLIHARLDNSAKSGGEQLPEVKSTKMVDNKRGGAGFSQSKGVEYIQTDC